MTKLEHPVGAAGSLRPAAQACRGPGSDMKLLLRHVLSLVYVTLTLELSSRCQMKSSPINLGCLFGFVFY